jgi:hypothetical protein
VDSCAALDSERLETYARLEQALSSDVIFLGLYFTVCTMNTLERISLWIGTFVVTVWVAVLFSKFFRFLFEEHVYHHFRFRRGIPQAITTMVHYVVLLIGILRRDEDAWGRS